MSISIAAIDAAIDALIAKQQVNHSVGDKSFSNGDKIRQLMELRRHLAEVPEVELETVTFDCDIELSGFDNTQNAVP
jgi:hypothetical protein